MIPVPMHVRDGAAEQSVYLLVGDSVSDDGGPALSLLPNTPAVQSAFAAMDSSMYFWRHNTTTGLALPFSIQPRAISCHCPHRPANMHRLEGSVRFYHAWVLASCCL